jgi:hypothetical protein
VDRAVGGGEWSRGEGGRARGGNEVHEDVTGGWHHLGSIRCGIGHYCAWCDILKTYVTIVLSKIVSLSPDSCAYKNCIAHKQ